MCATGVSLPAFLVEKWGNLWYNNKNIHLIAAGFPDIGYLYLGFPYLGKLYPARPRTDATCPGMGRLVDGILYIHDLALSVSETVADYVPNPLQFLQSGINAVRALLADFCKASGGVVPVLRQGQHHGEQPFGFQRQPRVAQVVVGHHRVVAGFLNVEYCHGITSFRRSKKC